MSESQANALRIQYVEKCFGGTGESKLNNFQVKSNLHFLRSLSGFFIDEYGRCRFVIIINFDK